MFSVTDTRGHRMVLVGAIGLEPTTPTMSRWCSNQLSYAPVLRFQFARKRAPTVVS